MQHGGTVSIDLLANDSLSAGTPVFPSDLVNTPGELAFKGLGRVALTAPDDLNFEAQIVYPVTIDNTDISAKSILSVDIGDGRPDLFVAAADFVGAPNAMFAGNGGDLDDGTFAFVDSGQRLGNSHSTDVVLFDADFSGSLDAFVSNGEDFGAPGDASLLYLNDGDGHFLAVDQGIGAGIVNGRAASGDINNDVITDVVLSGEQLLIARNRGLSFGIGRGTFDIETVEGTLSDKITDVALADVDRDGDLYLMATNLRAPDQLFLNQGGAQGGEIGTFVDSGQRFGSDPDDFSNRIEMRDLGGDGDADAIIGKSPVNFGEIDSVILVNDGTGHFTHADSGLTAGVAGAFVLADFDTTVSALIGEDSGLPFLMEKSAVDPQLVNGIAPELLVGVPKHDFRINVLAADDHSENSLGYYT